MNASIGQQVLPISACILVAPGDGVAFEKDPTFLYNKAKSLVIICCSIKQYNLLSIIVTFLNVYVGKIF